MSPNRHIPENAQANSVKKQGINRLFPMRFVLRMIIVLLFLLLSAQSIFKLQAQINAPSEAANIPSNVESVQSAFQPTGSLYATFFYPWYKNPAVDGTWGNWEGNGHSPTSNWFSNFLPIPPGSYNATTGVINPSAGLYSSRDKSVFYWQLNQMAAAKIEVGISSWWGQSVSATNDNPGIYAIQGRTDVSFRQIVTNWMKQADNPYPNMRWALYYEKESIANPSVTEIVSDLKYINTNYVNQPSYMKIGGRPVLFVYADGTDTCSMVTRWQQARAQSGVNFYLVLKLFSGYKNCSSQPDSWHQYAPASRTGNYPPYSSYLSPGFWKDGTSVTLPRSTTDFDTAAAAMVAANTQWKLVETWNEWGEGTSVEPGIQVQQTKTGTAIVAVNGAPFQNQYVQIMARRFPALPAGTGAGTLSTASPTPTPKPATAAPTAIKTATTAGASVMATTTQGTSVFLILMENHNWNQIKGSASAPYINSLLSQGAHAEAYYNPPGMHPSEPNYLWLEAGTNFGIKDDNQPSTNHQSTTAHLTTQLNAAGISWKSYQEDISGTVCPLSGVSLYAPKHNPMVFFDDVTGTNNSLSPYCIAHVRPYTELAADLAAGTAPRYNFITPNLCDDMHNSSGCVTGDSVKNGDNWLAKAVPAIQASSAYKNGGIIMITWDEGEGGDGPIGMIVLSPTAKHGYSNTIHYTHSSTLRTLQEIFGLQPLLRDAANATDLSDLFASMGAASTTPTPTLRPTNTPTLAPTNVSAPTATPAGSLTFNPVADSVVDSSQSSTNYGTSATVRTDASPTVRSYLRFNVQGVSGSITSATLRIYANSSSSIKYDVRPVSNTTWGETTITYGNAPAVGSITGSSAASFGASTWTNVDVTSLVKANGLISLALTSTNTTAVSFGSRESTHIPQLIVQTGGALAAAIQPMAAVAELTTSTPTDTITPMPTETATLTSTSQPTQTAALTVTATTVNESAVSAQPLPEGVTIIESDSPKVAGVSAWRQMAQPAGASGGTYLLNVDATGTLSLPFTGKTLGVGFVTGPSFGQFTIEVDGTAKQVVNTNSSDYTVTRVMIDGLGDGDHVMRVIPSAGVVAIDDFLVTAPTTVVAQVPTDEPTVITTEIIAAPPIIIPTTQPTQVSNSPTTEPITSLPTALPFPTLDIPTEEASVPTEVIPATDEVVSLPTALPFPTLDIPTAEANQPTLISPTQAPVLPISTLPVVSNMDDGAVDWQAVGSWTLIPEAAYGTSGLGWQAVGGNNDILHWNRQLDLHGTSGAQLSFETELSSAAAPLMVQVSVDGITWTTVATVNPAPDWQLTNVDLSAYAEQAIQLQFVWVDGVPGNMLRLDNVSVAASTPSAPTATVNASPLPPASETAQSPEPPTATQPSTLEMTPTPTLAVATNAPSPDTTAEATDAS